MVVTLLLRYSVLLRTCDSEHRRGAAVRGDGHCVCEDFLLLSLLDDCLKVVGRWSLVERSVFERSSGGGGISRL